MKRVLRCAFALLLCTLLLTGGVLAAASTESFVFYRQLTPAQKEIYDFLNTPESWEKMRSGETVEFPLLTGSYGDVSEIAALSSAYFDDSSYAFAALELDHPELFWVKGNSANCSYSYSGGTYKLYRYFNVTPEINWAAGTRSVHEDADALRYAVQAVAALAAGEDGTYAQLLVVHDYLTDTNVYNEAAAYAGNEADALPWTPLSALLPELSPVCEGYSRAFKLVCDELGIPCILVDGLAGGGHMWNQVLLDGRWYAVDVTWDDPVVDGVTDVWSGAEMHDYFLVGADTLTDGLRSFSDTHVPTGERVTGYRLDIPALSPTAYDPDAPQAGAQPSDAPVITRQDIPVSGTSYESTQAVRVDGRELLLPAYALRNAQGYDTNYVRLRDLAALLDGTDAQFDVLWSAETGITVVPGQPYAHRNGTENDVPFRGSQPYAAYLKDTLVGAKQQPLTAFQITFSGAGHTYYQLRDLGKALNFNVGWNADRGIYLETNVPYTDAD